MRKLLSCVLLGLMSVSVHAETPDRIEPPKLQLQGWQQKSAFELPRLFKIVKTAYWVQDISLWVDVPPGKNDWHMTANVICGALDAMGRPPKSFVALSFVDSTGNKPEFIAKMYCEPKSDVSPTIGQVLKELRG